jgi:hypothetical protein
VKINIYACCDILATRYGAVCDRSGLSESGEPSCLGLMIAS